MKEEVSECSFAENITVISEWESCGQRYRLVDLGFGPNQLQTINPLTHDKDWRQEPRHYVHGVLCSRINDLNCLCDALYEMEEQSQRNEDYYRGLVERCGKAIGSDAYVQDDGGVCDDVLCAKVPELVEALVSRSEKGGEA